MNITEEKIDDLNTIVRVKLIEEDYQPEVTTQLKEHRKKANVPGFRAGMVPMGMIKKMYAKGILADVINKKAANTISQHIQDQKWNILGQPIPKEDEMVNDLDRAEFDFVYEIGHAPEFDIDLTKGKYEQLEIAASDKLIEDNVLELRNRYGKVSEGEVSTEQSMLQGTFRELEGKEVKEGGVFHTSTITLKSVTDKKVLKTLTKVKAGDTIVVDPKLVSGSSADAAAMLNITEAEVSALTSKFEFEVSKIYNIEPAVLDQEFFDKIFGKDDVKSEKEMNSKIQEGIENQLKEESKKKVKFDIIEDLMSKTKLTFPDTFLKKWLKLSNDAVTDATLDLEYDGYVKGLKWQLIQNKIIKDNGIKVEHAEVIEYTKSLVKQQMMQYGIADMPDDELTKSAEGVLQKQEEAQRIYEMLYDNKMTDFLIGSVKIKNKKISYDDFVKLASEKKA